MTREHKLALIIGFTLVLVVGVLISDHFSKAHEARVKSELPEVPARNLAADGLRPVGGGGSIFGPASAVAARTSGNVGGSPDATLPPIHDPTLITEAGSTGGGEGAGNRGIVMGSNRWSTPAEDTNRIAVEVPRGFEPVNGQPGRGDNTLMQEGTRHLGEPSSATPPAPHGPGTALPTNSPDPNAVAPNGVRIVRPQGPTTTPPPPGPGSNLPVFPEPALVRPAPEEMINNVPLKMCTRHDVREGESLYGIAKSKYGDGSLWEKLREFNKGKVSANGAMREGVTLLLPPKEALQGKPLPMATPAPGSPAGRDQAPPARATPQKQNDPGTVESAIARSASGPRTYTVQKGDVLSEVAKKTLGSSRRWTEIQAMNADVLDDEDSLVVGMVLKLPVR